MRKLSNDELRVTRMQGIFDSLSKTEKPKTEIVIADKLDAIVRQLGAKLRRYGAILTTNQAAVQVRKCIFSQSHVSSKTLRL